jgi:8-oxo-dGTP diphosphatase
MNATAGYDPSDYPPFAVTVDLVILTIREGALATLLVRRGEEPFSGRWALPGGFVGIDEDLAAAARRELAEETGVSGSELYLEQLRSYGQPLRDPRMRVVSVAWLALAADLPDPAPGGDAAEAQWVRVDRALADGVEGMPLAFDHQAILGDGLERARGKIEYATIATEFCPERFTVGELRNVYEVVWGRSIDPRNFHRKVVASDGFVIETDETTTRGGGRPARLFTAGPAEAIHPPLLRRSA